MIEKLTGLIWGLVGMMYLIKATEANDMMWIAIGFAYLGIGHIYISRSFNTNKL